MRKDMFKVIVERPRRGGKYSRKGRGKTLENLPTKESMKRRHTDRKELNENLKPLERFLNSKVGQKWDKVYSEICEHLTPTSTVQQHVRDHLKDYVFTSIQIEGKKVYAQKRWSGTFRELYNGNLYVCPKTNVLKKYKVKKVQRKPFDNFLYELKEFSSSKSKTIFDNGEYYKLFFDKQTDDWTIKVKANKTHAKIDYQALSYYNQVGPFLYKHQKRIDFNNEYWKTMLDLYSAEKEVVVKKEEENPVGKKVKFSMDSGKFWREGIINRFEDYKSFKVYWVSTKDQNIRVQPGEGTVIKYLD